MKSKTKKGKCKTKFCRNKKHGFRSYCQTCNSRKYRADHPELYAYNTFVYNEKRRGKFVDLTFAEFLEVIEGTQYMELRGRKNESLTIHRIVQEGGAVKTNLKVVSNRANKEFYVAYLRNKKQIEGDIIINVEPIDF